MASSIIPTLQIDKQKQNQQTRSGSSSSSSSSRDSSLESPIYLTPTLTPIIGLTNVFLTPTTNTTTTTPDNDGDDDDDDISLSSNSLSFSPFTTELGVLEESPIGRLSTDAECPIKNILGQKYIKDGIHTSAPISFREHNLDDYRTSTPLFDTRKVSFGNEKMSPLSVNEYYNNINNNNNNNKSSKRPQLTPPVSSVDSLFNNSPSRESPFIPDETMNSQTVMTEEFNQLRQSVLSTACLFLVYFCLHSAFLFGHSFTVSAIILVVVATFTSFSGAYVLYSYWGDHLRSSSRQLDLEQEECVTYNYRHSSSSSLTSSESSRETHRYISLVIYLIISYVCLIICVMQLVLSATTLTLSIQQVSVTGESKPFIEQLFTGEKTLTFGIIVTVLSFLEIVLSLCAVVFSSKAIKYLNQTESMKNIDNNNNNNSYYDNNNHPGITSPTPVCFMQADAPYTVNSGGYDIRNLAVPPPRRSYTASTTQSLSSLSSLERRPGGGKGEVTGGKGRKMNNNKLNESKEERMERGEAKNDRRGGSLDILKQTEYTGKSVERDDTKNVSNGVVVKQTNINCNESGSINNNNSSTSSVLVNTSIVTSPQTRYSSESIQSTGNIRRDSRPISSTVEQQLINSESHPVVIAPYQTPR